MDFKKIKLIIFVVGILYSPISIFANSLSDAISLLEKKEYKKSIEILDILITENPEYSIAYNYRGYANMLLENYENALSDYQKSDGISSTIYSLSGIQWALLALGKNDESIPYGEKVLVLDPNNYYAKQRIADAYLEKKEYDLASEKYKAMETQFGKNADLLWKIGLCEYYKGNKEEAKKLFEEGKAISPEHKGIQYSLSGSGSYPSFAVVPEFTSFNFHGSDFVGNGQKSGLGVSYSPSENWNLRASVVNDRTQNLNSTKGVNNYFVDPVNLMYISQLKPPATISSYYFNSALNVYYLSKYLLSEDYATNKYSVGISYKATDRVSWHFNPQVLQSNASILNGGAAGQIGISYSNDFTLTFSGAAISTPQNKGGQIAINLYYPFLNYFYSSTTVNGQSMQVESNQIVFYSVTPLNVSYETVNVGKGYGFVQQELGFGYKYFYAGAGGRYGTSRTPIIGENWIYTGFDLLYGGYAQIGIKSEKLTLQLQYGHDKWLDSRGEKPTSDTVKFMIIWRL